MYSLCFLSISLQFMVYYHFIMCCSSCISKISFIMNYLFAYSFLKYIMLKFFLRIIRYYFKYHLYTVYLNISLQIFIYFFNYVLEKKITEYHVTLYPLILVIPNMMSLNLIFLLVNLIPVKLFMNLMNFIIETLLKCYPKIDDHFQTIIIQNYF
jgi:hypothetical protein